MKGKCSRGFGIITDPETGDEINVEDTFEVEQEVFDRLKANYPGIEAVSSGDGSGGSEGESTDTEREEYVCGVNGCSRTVDSESATCWQHPND